MAKQVGPYFITGCIDNVCFYEMDRQYYARMKSSLDGKRVKKDPAFKGLMLYAGMLGKASKLASLVNREIGGDKKGKSLFKPLKTEAYRMLREGIAADDVLYLLRLGVGLGKAEKEKLPDLAVDKEWDVDKLLEDLMIGQYGNLTISQSGNLKICRLSDLKTEYLDYEIPP